MIARSGSPVTEIAERGEDPLVIESRHGEHQGVRWKGPWGKHAQVLPGVAWPRRARQQYVEKPVEMVLSDARLDPLHEPPEADDPDPVVLGHVRGHQVDGGSHARVKSRFGERVEEYDNVAVALGMPSVHPHLSASRCETPVDVPEVVEGRVRTGLGELDAFRGHPAL